MRRKTLVENYIDIMISPNNGNINLTQRVDDMTIARDLLIKASEYKWLEDGEEEVLYKAIKVLEKLI